MSALDYLSRNYVTIFLSLVIIIITILFYSSNKQKKVVVYTIVFLTLLLSVLTYIELFLGNKTVFTRTDITWRLILSYLCYNIRPLIIFFLIMFSSEKSRNKWYLFLIPFIVNLIIYSFAFIPNNIVFTISNDNHFQGGILKYTCLVVSIVYLNGLLGHSLFVYRKGNRVLNILMLAIYILCAFGIFLDGLDGNYSILCNIIMVSCFSYYLYDIFEMKAMKEKALYNDLLEQKRVLLLSQIQPHFMYNTLNTIQYLCRSDPLTAEKAVRDFTKYLRANMDGINQSNLIPLEDELKHAKAYVSIEMLRFDNITVNFDIQYSDFKVPALTIQPLIENAIKHGVKDLDEGIINVKTFKKDNSCFIIIEDNGGGFDKEKYLKDGKNHIGLKNVIERIEMKGHGYVKIDSVIGKGTIITIEFKEGE